MASPVAEAQNPGMDRPLTPAEQIEAAQAVVRELLGDRLVGLYLGGSSVEGGVRPASDLDLLAVLGRSLSERERATLAERVMAVSGRRVGGRPIELTAVLRSRLHPWRYPPEAEFQYGDWLVEDIRQHGVPGPAPMPGLAVELTQVLRSGRCLTGPPADQVLDPVPTEDVVRSCHDAVPPLLDDLEGDERNVLLTFARIWCTVVTGDIRAKDEAAEWARPRLPQRLRPVLAHARDLYLGTTYDDETWPVGLRGEVATVVDHIIDRLPERPTATW